MIEKVQLHFKIKGDIQMSDNLFRCPFTNQFTGADRGFTEAMLEKDGYDVMKGPEDLVNRAQNGTANDGWYEIDDISPEMIDHGFGIETREEAEMRYFDSHEDDPDEGEESPVQLDFPGVSVHDEPLDYKTADRIGIQLKWYDPDEYELMILPQYEEGDEFDHLPTFEARRQTIIEASKYHLCAWEEKDHRWYINNLQNRTQKGKPSRFDKKGKCLNIQATRSNTHRQMDNIWLAEMTETDGMTSEDYLDAHVEIIGVEEHLEEVNEAIRQDWSEQERETEETNAADMHDAYLRGEYVAQPTVHELMLFGYYMPASSPCSQDHLDHMNDFYDPYQFEDESNTDRLIAEMEEDDRRDQEAFEREKEEAFLADAYTEIDEERERAPEKAAEEAAEALEAQFGHLPMGNAIGTKACLGHRVLIDA